MHEPYMNIINIVIINLYYELVLHDIIHESCINIDDNLTMNLYYKFALITLNSCHMI